MTPADVQIVNFEATRVLALEHRGDSNRLDESVAKFVTFRVQNALPPSRNATFNIAHTIGLSSGDDFHFDRAGYRRAGTTSVTTPCSCSASASFPRSARPRRSPTSSCP
jgi:hypothetical protein